MKEQGIPCKTYYKMNEDKILKYLEQEIATENVQQDVDNNDSLLLTDEIPSSENHSQLDVKNVNTNNNKINNKKNNNPISSNLVNNIDGIDSS
jgi:hypothetical protein